MELTGESIVMAGRARSAWAESDFERVFSEHYARIVSVLYRVVGDRARAEELASDTFLRLYRQPLGENEYRNLGGWLYRTAVRMGIDSLRSAVRRARYEDAAGQDLAVGPDTPLDELLLAERRRLVRAALARLKPKQAQILILRSSGLSYKEIAEVLGTKTNCVGRLLARAEAAFEKVWRRTAAVQPRRGWRNHVHF
ncbi:MAG: sigma-70 family RNA polymerase sigma factor [Rhodospirillales bacterium]